MKKKLTTIAVVAITLSLAACSPDIRTVEEQSKGMSGTQSGQTMSGESAKGPTLDDERISRIAKDVQEVLDQAMAENDPSLLSSRLTSGALEMREGQFLRASKTGTDLEPLTIDVNVASATASESWPRVLLVGTAATPEEPALVFIFTQRDATDDYMLENWVRALGGNSVRGVAVKDGTKTLAPDATGFQMSPERALETYVEHLNAPDNAELKVFDDKTLSPRYQEELKNLNDSVKEAGKVTAKASVNPDYPVTTVTLATGEALVATSFNYTHTYARTKAHTKMTVGGTTASYLDKPDVIGTVEVTYLVNVVFTIEPAGENDPIRVIGSERVITSVTKDDKAVPEGE